MSLAPALVSFTSRLDDARDVLVSLKDQEAQNLRGVPLRTAEYRVLAGTFFVLLYAALEHGVTQAVQQALREAGAASMRACDVSGPFYCVVLNPEFESAATVKSQKKWPARLRLLLKQDDVAPLPSIDDAVFNFDLQTTSSGTMQLIFDALGISDSIVPDDALRGYLDEVKDKRNLVAHGRERISTVGAGFTSNDLALRLDAINQTVTHFVLVLEKWVTDKAFAKVSARSRY
jgi:hypothetical protein